MVGIVVVSHSPDLAHAAVSLALEMVHGSAPRIEIAAGTSDDRIGTDAARVTQAIVAADDGDGVVVIMDLGSAVLSAELAIELLPKPRIPTRLVPAAFVEGIFAAVVSAAGGADLDAVAGEAEAALAVKIAQLDRTRAQPGAVVPDRPGTAIVAETKIVNQDGIHARPAALISGALASLDVRVTIATERSTSVSARSPTALMSLGTRVGDVLRIEAYGPDASAGIDRILDLVRDGFGELESTESRIQADFDSSSQRDGLETPLGVSSGRVVGPALQMADPAIEPDPVTRIPEVERSGAIKRLESATAQVAEQLRSRITAAGAVGELLEATAAVATDPDLMADASRLIGDEGLAPERAVWEVFGTAADTIRGAGPRQAERVTDLYDVRNRIVSTLIGRPAPGLPDPGYPYVLVAVDLAPADAAGLDATGCLAIVTEKGGPTAHAAIIARSLGLPAVVGVAGASAIPDGTLLLVDGATGELIIEPTIDQQATSTARQAHRDVLTGPGRTADGYGVALLANVASAGDVAAALQSGAEGVGLYRTELCFLDRAEAPSVAEQVSAYRDVFAAFGGRRVVVRTLDAGSDKPLPFLAYGREANPALGVRGFRTAVSYPEVLHDQLKAIKEAAEAESAEVWVMAPMIATVDEARNFGHAARSAGLPSIGVMIETPAAVMHADQILAEVDFLSIGTNDLAQYAFAADRHSGSLASLNDPWQPALLRMIDMVARAASARGKPVGVCGEAAADPLLALVLAGLGISSLSMAPAALAEVGHSLAAVALEACQRAARSACEADSPDHARKAARSVVND
ncbi:MAG TPA: phosphoenolpyruvate--protein phosphotransferase [Propionibacteriaceae bacterium]|nr:phosphoenolpyruvate--protein phosphotransferase [Propionibacteriaceae bacterium]